MRPSRSRPRVLYLIDYASSTGGAERFAVGLATHLPQDRFEPWLCATRSCDEISARALDAAGVRHLTLGRQAKWDIHRLGGLASLLRRERFDILHTHKFASNVWGTAIGSACRVPVMVAHEHSWGYEGEPGRAWLDGQMVGRLATRFVAVSSADGERMVSHEHVDPGKVVVIPNGYIPSPVATDTDVRAELGLDSQALIIGIAAVLRPEKRIDLLLAAHVKVREQVPRAHLVIAGDGECRHALETQAHALGIEDAVHFLGARSDVDSVLRAADVGALSSDREGSPLLVFECMANNAPMVATAVGGVPDVLEHERTGLLVPRRDPAALASGLIRLLTEPERRLAMATAGRDALHRYTIDVIAGRFGSLYDSLVDGRR
ncbi:MAG: glycosyltransferase [Solirubrobacteraceae bacterium]